MNTLQTLYMVLDMRNRIKDEHKRVMYLQEVWGMSQESISRCEGVSQPSISRIVSEAKKVVSGADVNDMRKMPWKLEELEFIRSLPREVLSDASYVAFVNDILGIDITHPLFLKFDKDTAVRMSALAHMGVRQKYIAIIYKKSHASVSSSIKRLGDRVLRIERYARYDKTPLVIASSMSVSPFVTSQKFTLAGGQ